MDFNESSTPQLPIYTSSVSLPSYTHELASGERRLQHTPRSNDHRPTSVFIKKSRKAAVVLNNQEEGACIPTFGRASVISGFISLEDRHNILEVNTYVSRLFDSLLEHWFIFACRLRASLRPLLLRLVAVPTHCSRTTTCFGRVRVHLMTCVLATSLSHSFFPLPSKTATQLFLCLHHICAISSIYRSFLSEFLISYAL